MSEMNATNIVNSTDPPTDSQTCKDPTVFVAILNGITNGVKNGTKEDATTIGFSGDAIANNPI